MSDVWESYASRLGGNLNDRNGILVHEKSVLRRKLPYSLSYHTANIDGEERQLAIINSDNLDIKTLCSLPGEDIRHGALVYWMDNYWLVTEKDANNEVYTRAKMQQCNYLLRWVNTQGEIIERWSIVSDGTKYLTGTYGDHFYIMERGDARIQVILALDDETAKLNRTSRFLIDYYGSDNVMAYRLTKPLKVGANYNDNGVFSFVLAECNTEDDDNLEMHIADYYKYFPRPDGYNKDIPAPEDPGRKVWI